MDVIMSAMASQITGVSMVCSTVCSGADQRIHQSSASLAFVRGIHRWPETFPHKLPVTRKMFPFDDVIKRRFGLPAPWLWYSSTFRCLSCNELHYQRYMLEDVWKRPQESPWNHSLKRNRSQAPFKFLGCVFAILKSTGSLLNTKC